MSQRKTATGNSLSYAITGLPAGLVDDTDGTFDRWWAPINPV